jgi:hypothetical protein
MDDSNPINAMTMGSSSFPRSPSQFDDDPRVSFSKLDNKHILETDDGEEYFFDPILKRWVPSVGSFVVVVSSVYSPPSCFLLSRSFPCVVATCAS